MCNYAQLNTRRSTYLHIENVCIYDKKCLQLYKFLHNASFYFPRIRPQTRCFELLLSMTTRPNMVTTTFGPSRKGLDVRWQQRWLLCHFHIGLLVKSVPNLWAYSFWIWLLSITLGRKWQTKEKHVIQSGSRFPLCKKLWTWGRGSIKKTRKVTDIFLWCVLKCKNWIKHQK